METARCRAFLAAAETGSFSKAAEALSYTPSGVNQLVSALEKEFGFPLFRRNTKGVSLTENGELLLPVIRKFLRQEDRIFELSAEMNGLLIGSVNIAAYSSIATHWLPAVISAQSAFDDFWKGKNVDPSQFAAQGRLPSISAPAGENYGAAFTAWKPTFDEIFLGRTAVVEGLKKAEAAANKANES